MSMDFEAYQIVIELLAQAHEYGEANSDKMELWISISSGLIVMAYFAPERLKLGISTMILLVYIAFSMFLHN